MGMRGVLSSGEGIPDYHREYDPAWVPQQDWTSKKRVEIFCLRRKSNHAFFLSCPRSFVEIGDELPCPFYHLLGIHA
jgi:hypothetical protein